MESGTFIHSLIIVIIIILRDSAPRITNGLESNRNQDHDLRNITVMISGDLEQIYISP